MTTLLLVVLVIAPIGSVAFAVCSRRNRTERRAVALTALSLRDPGGVMEHTQACASLASIALQHPGEIPRDLLRSVVRDAVVQIDALLRAARLRVALGSPRAAVTRTLGWWVEFLLFVPRLAHPDVVVALLAGRGGCAAADLEAMAAAAVERFNASLGDEALVESFAEVLVQCGLLDPEDLDAPPVCSAAVRPPGRPLPPA